MEINGFGIGKDGIRTDAWVEVKEASQDDDNTKFPMFNITDTLIAR